MKNLLLAVATAALVSPYALTAFAQTQSVTKTLEGEKDGHRDR